MHKNIGPFLAFNELFFKRHQRVLLFLVNGPIVKYWFRWILRIRKCDCSFDTRITQIGPSRFSYGDRYFKKGKKWYLERTSDFRTHPKYGKRLYLAFKPVWWLVHAWDQVANLLNQPAWNFGFDTLTAYPDAGTGSTTVDGSIFHDEATWAGCRAALTTDGGDGSPNTVGTDGNPCQTNYAAGVYIIIRGFFLFDTTLLPDTASISAAVFSLFGCTSVTNTNSSDVDIVSCSPASNSTLVGDDFDQVGSIVFASKALSAWSTSAYNDFALDANGVANISKTGVSKFGVRNSRDTDNLTPTGNNRCFCYFADQAGTSQDPKLVVTYLSSTTYTATLSATVSASPVLFRISNFFRTFSISSVVSGALNRVSTLLRTLTTSALCSLGTSTPVSADSYSESNVDSWNPAYSGASMRGQSFTAIDGAIDSCKFYLKSAGTITGTMVAKLFAHTGTYGSSSKGTGTVLATSDPINVSVLSGSPQLVSFSFVGANRCEVPAGYYVIALEFTGGSVSNWVLVGYDSTNPAHSGNGSYYISPNWTAVSEDHSFYVYQVPSTILSRAVMLARVLTTSAVLSASITRLRSAFRTLTAIITSSQTLLKGKTTIRTIAATSSWVSTVSDIRNLYRTLSGSLAALQSLVKGRYLSLIPSLTGSATITKSALTIQYLALPVSIATSVGLALFKTFYRTLTASISPSWTLTQLANHYLSLSATATSSASQAREKLIGRILLGAAATAVALSKAFAYTRELATSAGATASLTLKKTFYRTLAVPGRLFGSVGKMVLDVWRKVTRNTDASYTSVARSADATYNKVSRDSDDSFNQVPRQHS